MAEPLRLLSIGRDSSLFEDGPDVPGDARRRHVRYAEMMRAMLGDESEIRVITYTTRSSGFRRDDPAPGLKLYGTASLHRSSFLLDCARIVREILNSGWRPAAITAQTPWEEGSLAAILARSLGVRFLPQLHGDPFNAEWRSENLLNHWRGMVCRRVLRSGTRVRVVSEPLRRKVETELGIHRSRIDVIPVGVNFKPSNLSVDQAKAALDPRLAGRPVVLFVGRLVPEKNLGLWLDVAQDVLGEIAESCFVIVGGGAEESRLRQIVTARHQQHSILLTGPVGHPRLPDVYRAADVFLLTSHHEGFGRVILEAALAGVPSVATRCTGPEGIIDHGVSGILAAKGDRHDLAQAVIGLLRDPQRRESLGNHARASAHATFGLDVLAAKLVEHWSRT